MTRERTGIYFIFAVVAVVALGLVGFNVGGPLAGLIIIICVVGGFLVGRRVVDRDRGPVEVAAAPEDDVRRLLVIAHEGLGDERLATALKERAAERTHVHVVVPALADAADRLSGDQETRNEAVKDMERLVSQLQGDFSHVDGGLGDPNPTLALEDALRIFPADEVIIVNPPEGQKGPMEEAATRRAKEDVPLRVTELNLG